MKFVRTVIAPIALMGVMGGTLFVVGGCGDAASGPDGGTVKDAPPMTPEQQKSFDQYYKKGPEAAPKK